jgi:ABC-type lipoprotein release transport system permease subunit
LSGETNGADVISESTTSPVSVMVTSVSPKYFEISAATSRLLTSFLFGLTATDGITFIGGSMVLCLVAIVATYLPARRAAHVDPLVALRHE